MPAGLDGNRNPIVTPERTAVIASVVNQITIRRQSGKPMLVALDGVDGAGKSTLADEVATECKRSGLNVVRSTIDSFHNPCDIRWRLGRTSPVGFYLDSHDLDALRDRLLDPFKRGTGETILSAVFDEPSDQPVHAEPVVVRANDVLIFDGLFLQRSELVEYWNFVIFVDGQQRVNLQRLGLIFADLPEDPEEVVSHTLEWTSRIERYSAGMRHYLDLVDPIAHADVVIDNNDLSKPTIRTS